eukprot:TRINITY_DN5554_c0_g1_i1.p1 TRINITY_DN5554_c0_g1~~TRINITY_DN5554_c0_g1_i1.p1  ORF type:complete len:464 (+),score=93.43 TRINITY_DN5554_c0_g1_i1:49-1392(+)
MSQLSEHSIEDSALNAPSLTEELSIGKSGETSIDNSEGKSTSKTNLSLENLPKFVNGGRVNESGGVTPKSNSYNNGYNSLSVSRQIVMPSSPRNSKYATVSPRRFIARHLKRLDGKMVPKNDGDEEEPTRKNSARSHLTKSPSCSPRQSDTKSRDLTKEEGIDEAKPNHVQHDCDCVLCKAGANWDNKENMSSSTINNVTSATNTISSNNSVPLLSLSPNSSRNIEHQKSWPPFPSPRARVARVTKNSTQLSPRVSEKSGMNNSHKPNISSSSSSQKDTGIPLEQQSIEEMKAKLSELYSAYNTLLLTAESQQQPHITLNPPKINTSHLSSSPYTGPSFGDEIARGNSRDILSFLSQSEEELLYGEMNGSLGLMTTNNDQESLSDIYSHLNTQQQKQNEIDCNYNTRNNRSQLYDCTSEDEYSEIEYKDITLLQPHNVNCSNLLEEV